MLKTNPNLFTHLSHILLWTLATLFSATNALGDLPPPPQPEAQPNIIIFMVDDMGVMDTSVPFLTNAEHQAIQYPLNRFYRTPSMERLANQGIRFNHFHTMSVCSPSRISLMTGQTSARHRTTNWINPTQNNRTPNGPSDWNWSGLKQDSLTLPKLLQQSGYRTIHIGKAHFGPEGSEGADPTHLGFDINIGGSPIGQPGSYYAKEGFGKGSTHPVPHLEDIHDSTLFLTEALTQRAVTEIDAALTADKPFFLHLSHYAVHAPFQSDPRFASDYLNSGKTPPAQAFATLIAGIDQSLGDVIRHLEKCGIAEKTLIFFLGDNGTDAPLGNQHLVACAEPLRGKKGSHYEGGTRVPFIASWGKPNPTHPIQTQYPIATNTIQAQTSNICDLFPTILELIQHPLPPEYRIDGQSLRVLLSGNPDPEKHQEFLMHFPHQHRSSYFTSFHQGRWKVIYHYFPSEQSEQSDGKRYQLFDLEFDPFESHNLADEQPVELERMMKLLIEALRDRNALYPQTNEGESVPPVLPPRGRPPRGRSDN